MMNDIPTFGPKHNLMGDISSLGVLAATTVHYLPEIAYAMPAIYYGMLSINQLIDWRNRWRASYREEGRVTEVKRVQDAKE